jgi:hypothetical protein
MTTGLQIETKADTTRAGDFWAQLETLQRHPAYLTGHQTDPVRGLLAAVVLRVILDINPHRRIKAYYRETARQFLIDREGQEWLRCFGIPPAKILPFVKNLD